MKTKPHLLPWLMWIAALSFFCYEFFLQVSPGIMAHDLMHSFAINATDLGTFAAVYFYAYLVMQIPGGVLIDYFGVRRLLTLSVFICALGTLLFATTHIFYLAVLGRLLIGLGSASAYISCVYIAATWLPINRFSMLNGIIVTIGMLGAILGQVPLALLVAKLSWRNTMLLFGIIGLLLVFVMWFIIRDRHTQHNKDELQQAEKKLLRGLKYIMRSKQTWLCAIYGCLIYTPTLILGTLWGVPFLTHQYHLSNPAAANLVAMLFLGWAIGSPLFGELSDRFRRRKIFLLITAAITLFIVAALIYLPQMPYIVLALLLFGVGFSSSAEILAFSIVREINPQFAVGAAMGFMNGLNMLGGALLPPVIGFILDKTKFNYKLGLTILPIIFAIALILALQIKETYATLKFNHE